MRDSIQWPDVPKPRHRSEPVCDRCDRDAQPGSVLCAGCEDRQYCYDKEAAEEVGDE